MSRHETRRRNGSKAIPILAASSSERSAAKTKAARIIRAKIQIKALIIWHVIITEKRLENIELFQFTQFS
jgi:hypothetical protein